MGAAEAEIFEAQKMIAQDPSLLEKATALIRDDNMDAPHAVARVLDSYEARIQELDDEYLRERSSDIGEVKRRLLDIMGDVNPEFQCADSENCQRGRDRIVVAEELTPMMTMELDSDHTLAFVTERGGINSHAAILARALGIPAVSGIVGAHKLITCGTELLVNGDTGEVLVGPSEQVLAEMDTPSAILAGLPEAADPVDGLTVMANISRASEADDALSMKAEGIGLYRTEFEFMVAGRMLSEDEQYERYSGVVKKMAGRPVVFRLFDAGGDKPLQFLDIQPEENPALGWRGGRLLLGHAELMRTQARALARASVHGPVRVMYPMVVDLEQFRELKALFESSLSGLPPGDLQHGVMFEVPSACLQAEEILREADFGSIGTNDLIQYLFAVDRNNELVAYDYKPGRSALWSLLGQMSEGAKRVGKELSVCGELAGKPDYLRRLVEIGITSLSVSPRLISRIRREAVARVEEDATT